jgi:hypothetical protein
LGVRVRDVVEEHLGGCHRPSRLTSTIWRISAFLLGAERREQHHAGVVHEDVGAAQVAVHALRGRDDRVAVGDVRLDGERAVAELLGQRASGRVAYAG